jgi:hypothetical protein
VAHISACGPGRPRSKTSSDDKKDTLTEAPHPMALRASRSRCGRRGKPCRCIQEGESDTQGAPPAACAGAPPSRASGIGGRTDTAPTGRWSEARAARSGSYPAWRAAGSEDRCGQRDRSSEAGPRLPALVELALILLLAARAIRLTPEVALREPLEASRASSVRLRALLALPPVVVGHAGHPATAHRADRHAIRVRRRSRNSNRTRWAGRFIKVADSAQCLEARGPKDATNVARVHQ